MHTHQSAWPLVFSYVVLQPAGISFMKHIKAIRDPSTLAILYEDGAACLGMYVYMCMYVYMYAYMFSNVTMHLRQISKRLLSLPMCCT
jgi:ABC-type sulfate transport system permease component